MEFYNAGKYDIAVIGAGHAGVEAALAAARLGCNTIMFTVSVDAIANMPCNPSIGGTAKGHLVRELDALGGEMGKVADATMLQSRMLNRGKGPAVHSLRVQSDRTAYHNTMKKIVESQENLMIKQAEIVEVLAEDGKVCAVVTAMGARYDVKKVIIAAGTFLKAKVFAGEYSQESGPDGLHAANELSASLIKIGIDIRRFKTGTPARVHRRSIDFDKLEVQAGDEPIVPFSFETDPDTLKNTHICHIAYTNVDTHNVILENIHRSPIYAGEIEGIGPRYCPSIEDKVKRFSDKERHQIFVEPMGEHTEEIYLQGMSSSLPEEVQMKMYRTIKGLEHVEMIRTAYGIEYDCIDPTQLLPTLEFKKVSGLYGSGQFNGTSGYEEAAVQGYVAGVNAARAITDREPFVPDRANSYIGTLIDDLVTKGCSDPYRMMTSRSEYRLVLRQDNADVRLTPIGYEIGLISEHRYNNFLNEQAQKKSEIERLAKVSIQPTDAVNEYLVSVGTAPLKQSVKAQELIKRPQISYDGLMSTQENAPVLSARVREQVEIEIKYEGYIKKQNAQIEQMKRLETMSLANIGIYSDIKGLSLEAVDKLEKIRPLNLGQASRISGVSPADISVLVIVIETRRQGE